MKQNIKFYMLLVMIFMCLPVFAQKDITGKKWFQRIYYTGVIGGSFGSSYSYAEVSPRIGYMITNKWSAGIGISYLYRADHINLISSRIYGGSTYGRYNVSKTVFAQTEVEMMNVAYTLNDKKQVQYGRTWVPGWLLGGGIYQPLGGRVGLTIAGYINVLYNSRRSPYSSPFLVRIGFSF